MRLNKIALLATPLLVAGQDQGPFLDVAKGWFEKAQAAVRLATTLSGQAASAKVAEHAVTPLTFSNWRDTLSHSGSVKTQNPPEAWMVYITGGNRTCGGRCGKADLAWNESVAVFVADPSAPNLASIDCEAEEMLCGAWGALTATIWVILVPQPLPDQSKGPTHITVHRLNTTTVTEDEITRLHTRKLYLGAPRYEGVLHPFDGWIAQYGLTEPMAVGLYYFSKIPSWAFMIGLSFFSRYFVNRRMPTGRPAPTAPTS